MLLQVSGLTTTAGGCFHQLSWFSVARAGLFFYVQQAEQLLQQYHINLSRSDKTQAAWLGEKIDTQKVGFTPMGLIPTESWEFCFSETRDKVKVEGKQRRSPPPAALPSLRGHSPMSSSATAAVWVGHWCGHEPHGGGLMVGGLSGTGRPSNNRGLGTGRATVPWTVWKGTRRATISLCLCDSRAQVGPRRHDGHGVCIRMVGGDILRHSTPTLPPVRFRTLELPHSPQIRRPTTPVLLPPEE